MRQLKRDMRESRAVRSFPTESNVPALRSDVRDLMRQFRDLKRTQKFQRKAFKRERKVVRRQQKRERRSLRREAKRERKASKGKGRAIGGYQTPPIISVPPPMVGSLGPSEIGRSGVLLGANAQQFNSLNVSRAGPTPTDGARMQAEAQRLMNDAEKKIVDAHSLREQAQIMQSDDKGRLKIMDIVERLEEEAEKLQREANRLMAEADQTDREYDERGVDHSQQQSGVIHA